MKLDSEKEWFIQAPWGRLSIMAWGDCCDPPVLLCHGEVDSAVSFKPLIQHLPDKFYYIAMEIPGNGKSDPFPPGMMINAYDVVYAIEVVVKHFRWTRFVYVAHSLGTLLGKLYNLSYPGLMSKVVELDPTPVFKAVPPADFAQWYHRYYTRFYDKFDVFNSPKEKAPKYKRQIALQKVMSNRGLPQKIADMVLDRISEPVGVGLVRFTFDQRTKLITRPPFTPTQMQKFYTNIPTPTLTIVADSSVKAGYYDKVDFALNEAAYPNRNYRVREVRGSHDLHLVHPERVAGYVNQFLLHGLEGLDRKAKL